MCGRYASYRSDSDLARTFKVAETIGPERPPSWNVAPQQNVRVVLERAKPDEPEVTKRQLRRARWGLVPHWASDPSIGNRMINARSESVLERPAFKNAARKHRLIVPADGYYEWQRLDETGKTKRPYYLHAEDEAPLAFAGLYECRRDPALPEDHPDAWLWTCTIMTTTASDTLGHVHDRSPVIVPPDVLDDWLDPTVTDPADVRELVAAMPEPRLVPRPVSSAVGNVRNDGPELINPVELAGGS